MQDFEEQRLISVIVVTYNQEATIGRTLRSILRQRCSWPVEIVVGDDCSTDQTLSVCQRFEREHPGKIRILHRERNLGVVENYFDCMLKCRGKYIADCAGDDFWTDDEKLEKQLRVMESHPEVTLVHTDWNYYDEPSGRTFHRGSQRFSSFLTDGRLMMEAIATQEVRPVVHLCTSLYRASAVRSAYMEHQDLFTDRSAGCEDLQVAYFLAERGTIAYLPEATLSYSRGHESVSESSDEEKQFRYVLDTTWLSFRLLQRSGLWSKAAEGFFGRRCFALAMHAFRARSPQLRSTAKQLPAQWNTRPALPYRLVMLATSNPLTWQMGLSARAVFVKMKKQIVKMKA